MRIEHTNVSARALVDAPVSVQRAFLKQVKLLLEDFRHPSLRAKKYGGADDVWQARVNRDWRFYFRVVNDAYVVVNIVPHPK